MIYRVSIINFLKKSPTILYMCGFIYSTLNCWYHLSYWRALFSSKCTFKGAFMKDVSFKMDGAKRIYIGPKTQLNSCSIIMNGSGHELYVEGSGTCVNNVSFLFLGSNSKCEIANNFSMEGGSFNLLEGKSITIGNDCMFSTGLYITVSDYHSITSLITGARINQSNNINIGNHVWVGKDSKILKGVEIAQNTIIGANSVVTQHLMQENAIYCGIPAKLIKESVTWKRDL